MTDQAVSQDLLDEALDPSLSEDFFLFEGRKVQLKPLKVKYQKQWTKAFAPIADSMAYSLANNQQVMKVDEIGRTYYDTKRSLNDLSLSDWVAMGASLLEQVDVLPRLIQILCHNDDVMISDDELDNSSMQAEDMQGIVLRHCQKAGAIERQVADFFLTVLPAVRGEVSKSLQDLKEKALNSTTTA